MLLDSRFGLQNTSLLDLMDHHTYIIIIVLILTWFDGGVDVLAKGRTGNITQTGDQAQHLKDFNFSNILILCYITPIISRIFFPPSLAADRLSHPWGTFP